jgi:hypothetical protein
MIPRVGLCSVCAHARLVATRRGSAFFLCGLSKRDDRFPRYPRLPVLRCAGFVEGEPRAPGGAGGATAGGDGDGDGGGGEEGSGEGPPDR